MDEETYDRLPGRRYPSGDRSYWHNYKLPVNRGRDNRSRAFRYCIHIPHSHSRWCWFPGYLQEPAWSLRRTPNRWRFHGWRSTLAYARISREIRLPTEIWEFGSGTHRSIPPRWLSGIQYEWIAGSRWLNRLPHTSPKGWFLLSRLSRLSPVYLPIIQTTKTRQ